MPKSTSNPLKTWPKLSHDIMRWYRDNVDFSPPVFTVCAALQHASAAITRSSYAMMINTLTPMQLAYFGSAVGQVETGQKLLRYAYFKAWVFNDKPTLKVLKKYLRTFEDAMIRFVRSHPTKEAAAEALARIDANETNLYNASFWRYRACLEHPSLLKLEYIDVISYELDWLGAWFCHLVRVHRPELEPQVMEILPRHPGFVGHLANVGEEYRNVG